MGEVPASERSSVRGSSGDGNQCEQHRSVGHYCCGGVGAAVQQQSTADAVMGGLRSGVVRLAISKSGEPRFYRHRPVVPASTGAARNHVDLDARAPREAGDADARSRGESSRIEIGGVHGIHPIVILVEVH